MRTAKQRRPRLAHLVDIGVVIRRITHRHDDIHRIAKLLMDSLQRGNMFIAAIPGVADQNSQGITARGVIGQGIQRRIHTGREVEQLARDARMAVSEPAEIAAGGENAPYSPLRHAA